MTKLHRQTSTSLIDKSARFVLWAVFAGVIAFLILPSLIVIPMSFSGAPFLEFPPETWSLRWYQEFVTSPKWMNALSTSLIVGAFTMLLATSLGTLAAYVIVQSTRRMGYAFLLVCMVPIIVPVVLIAVGTFYVFGQLGLNNSITGLVIAHTALALPISLIVVLSGLRTIDMTHELAARSLGATRLAAFWLITLPQVRPAVLTAAVLSFLMSFDEVIVSTFVSGGGVATLPKQMFASLRDFIDPTIAAISTLTTLFSFFLLLALRLAIRNRS